MFFSAKKVEAYLPVQVWGVYKFMFGWFPLVFQVCSILRTFLRKRNAICRSQRKEIITLGRKVAEALDVTFLVIDVAMKTDGEWILIECNDGQDSGFTGVNPFRLWNDTVSAIQQQASLS